jgi:hypothetical protein
MIQASLLDQTGEGRYLTRWRQVTVTRSHRCSNAEHSVSLLNQIVGSAATLRDAALIQWAPTLRQGIESGKARPDLDVRQGCHWLLEVQFRPLIAGRRS